MAASKVEHVRRERARDGESAFQKRSRRLTGAYPLMVGGEATQLWRANRERAGMRGPGVKRGSVLGGLL